MDDIDDQELDTLSLTDFPITNDGEDHHHRKPPSSAAADDIFEFFHGGFGNHSQEPTMSHAEDIIFHGKLIPVNQFRQPIHRRRSESLPELKTNTAGRPAGSGKKLHRKSSMRSEPAPEIYWNSLGKKLSFSSPSRRRVLTFGVVKVPPEMDPLDIKNRQVRRNASTLLFPAVKGDDDRKSSWRVLRFLSCQSHAGVAETASLRCLPKE